MKPLVKLLTTGFLCLTALGHAYEDLELEPPEVSFYLDTALSQGSYDDFEPYASDAPVGIAMNFGFTNGKDPDSKWAFEGGFTKFTEENDHIVSTFLPKVAPSLRRSLGIPLTATNLEGISSTRITTRAGTLSLGTRYLISKINRTAFYARGGLHLWDVDLVSTPSDYIFFDNAGTREKVQLLNPQNVDSDNGFSFYGALGAEQRIADSHGVFAEYSFLKFGDESVPYFALGIRYLFNHK